MLAAVAGGVPAAAPPVQVAQPVYTPPPPPVQRQQWINLTNFASGLCLDTDGQSVNGGQVRMWNCVNSANQTWTMINVGSGYHTAWRPPLKSCPTI